MIQPKDDKPQNEPNDQARKIYLAALNDLLAKESTRHNNAPDPSMGGLSPEQVSNLLYSPWGEPGSLIQVDHHLPGETYQASAFFRRAGMLLLAVVEAGGVKATPGKYLNRRFVEDLVKRMFTDEEQADLWRFSKKLDELDVWPMHIARVVCGVAKLLRLHNGAFVVPKKKQVLLDDLFAGHLFEFLFLAYFREFNFAYLNQIGPEAVSVQRCIGYSLYRIGEAARDWVPMEGLAVQILLPYVRKDVEREVVGDKYFTMDRVMEMHVIRPLLDWGFLEATYEKPVYAYFRGKPATIRITPLYRAFFRFGTTI